MPTKTKQQAFIYVKNADGTFSRQTDPASPNCAEIEEVLGKEDEEEG
jgi:hypothetical protein